MRGRKPAASRPSRPSQPVLRSLQRNGATEIKSNISSPRPGMSFRIRQNLLLEDAIVQHQCVGWVIVRFIAELAIPIVCLLRALNTVHKLPDSSSGIWIMFGPDKALGPYLWFIARFSNPPRTAGGLVGTHRSMRLFHFPFSTRSNFLEPALESRQGRSQGKGWQASKATMPNYERQPYTVMANSGGHRISSEMRDHHSGNPSALGKRGSTGPKSRVAVATPCR